MYGFDYESCVLLDLDNVGRILDDLSIHSSWNNIRRVQDEICIHLNKIGKVLDNSERVLDDSGRVLKDICIYLDEMTKKKIYDALHQIKTVENTGGCQFFIPTTSLALSSLDSVNC